jgi:hypothetical protein
MGVHTGATRGAAATLRSIQRERALVQAAVLLVAGGGVLRVTVSGLRHAGLIIPEAQRTGLLEGVDARVESAASRRRSRVVVERPSS